MLTRIEARDWFTLRHFDARTGRVAVVLPAPGKDPTDPLDILDILRQLVVEGQPVTRMFPRRSLPGTQRHFYQSFELELRGDGGTFTYELVVQQHRHRDSGARSDTEALWHDGSHVATYLRGTLVPDEHDLHDPDLPERVDWNVSAIGKVAGGHDPRITAFRAQLARLHLLRVDPPWQLPGAPEPTAEQRAEITARQVDRARELLREATRLLRDPGATVSVVLPDEWLALAELRAWLTPAVDAALAGRGGQLLLSTGRRELYEPLAAEHGVSVADPPPRPRAPDRPSGQPRRR